MLSQRGQLCGKTHYLRLSLSWVLNAISLIFYFSSGQLLDLCEYRLCAHSITPLRSMVLANVFEILQYLETAQNVLSPFPTLGNFGANSMCQHDLKMSQWPLHLDE